MSKSERTSEEIREQKFRIFSEQSGLCFACHEPMALTEMQLAHRIAQTKPNLRLWGEAVIHHRKNFRGTHAWCNSKVSLNPYSLEAERLVKEIRRDLKNQKDFRYRHG